MSFKKEKLTNYIKYTKNNSNTRSICMQDNISHYFSALLFFKIIYAIIIFFTHYNIQILLTPAGSHAGST